MAKRKRILHIQLWPLLSGVQNVTLGILGAMDRERWEIFVACKPCGPLVDEVKRRGWRYLPVPSLCRAFTPLDLLAFLHLFLLCRRYRFDVVHTHSSKTGFLGRIAARLAGVPRVVHTVHGFPFHEGQPWLLRRVYMALERVAARFCDRVAFVSRGDYEFAIARGLVAPGQAMLIRNGMAVRPVTRENWPPLSGKLVVGWSGRFMKQKNPLVTVEAACRAATRREELAFVFLGDGELLDACRHMVAATGLTDRILLPGWQDVQNWLPRCDVFMLYSRWEGLPLSVLEAMAAGLPAIVSAIGGNDELVDERNGWRISVKDVSGLERLLLSLPDQRDELARRGQAALDRIRTEFDRERFIRQNMELYEA